MNKPLQSTESMSPASPPEQAEATVAKIAPIKTARSPEEKILHELRRAQAELHSSRARYFDLYEFAPVGYVTVSGTGLILESNVAAASLLDLPRNEMINAPISRMIHKDDQDIYHLMHKRLIGTDAPQTCDLRMAKSDGTIFWAHLAATTMRDENGSTGCRVVLSDITGQKQVEESLRESELRLRAIIENEPECIKIVNAEGRLLQMNPTGLAMIEADSIEQVQGCRILDVIAPEYRAAFADLHRRVIAGESIQMEFEVQGLRGGRRWLETHAVPMLEKGQTVHLAVTRDITARKRAEEKILQLSMAVEQSPVLIIITNRNGAIEYVNPKFCAVTGYTREEVMGRNPRILKSGDKSPEEYRELWTTINAGKEWQGEFHNKKKSGELYWESACISPIRNESGRIAHFLAVKEDITERKQAEKELQEKNAEIKRFTNTVSHDLKSPLVTIKTFLGYLEEDIKTRNAGATDKDLGYIRGAADKMERMLNELLELARIGHMANAPVTVPLQEIVKEALLLVAGQIATRRVLVEVTQEPVWLHGDRSRLVEVFQNLLDNAVKFLGDQPAPRIEIGMEPEDGEVVLFVRDNGRGIDSRHQSKLFGLFEKLDPHTPGSGIGLAMVRRIVEAHGGKIRVQSAGSGKGAEFRFTLAKTQMRKQIL